MATRQAILQDLYRPQRLQPLKTSVTDAGCYVCGMGIDEGHSITAKTLRDVTVMFCDTHYPEN